MRGKKATRIEIPKAFVPFVGQAGNYKVSITKEGDIILSPKEPTTNGHGSRMPLATAHTTQARTNIERARLRYTVADKRLTPKRAEVFGMSKTRLKVYKALYSHKKGLLARDVMEQAKLPHGSVQQTLNWLRSHKLVAAETLAA